MIIDYTIPLWGVLTYLLGSIAVVAGFVYKVITLEFKLNAADTRSTQIEKELVELKEKISLVEYDQKNEVRSILKSIDDIKESFHELNLNLRLLLEDKRNKENQINK